MERSHLSLTAQLLELRPRRGISLADRDVSTSCGVSADRFVSIVAAFFIRGRTTRLWRKIVRAGDGINLKDSVDFPIFEDLDGSPVEHLFLCKDMSRVLSLVLRPRNLRSLLMDIGICQVLREVIFRHELDFAERAEALAAFASISRGLPECQSERLLYPVEDMRLDYVPSRNAPKILKARLTESNTTAKETGETIRRSVIEAVLWALARLYRLRKHARFLLAERVSPNEEARGVLEAIFSLITFREALRICEDAEAIQIFRELLSRACPSLRVRAEFVGEFESLVGETLKRGADLGLLGGKESSLKKLMEQEIDDRAQRTPKSDEPCTVIAIGDPATLRQDLDAMLLAMHGAVDIVVYLSQSHVVINFISPTAMHEALSGNYGLRFSAWAPYQGTIDCLEAYRRLPKWTECIRFILK